MVLDLKAPVSAEPAALFKLWRLFSSWWSFLFRTRLLAGAAQRRTH
jgi:hypothetical protein